MSEISETSGVIRGHSRLDRPATALSRKMAWVVDFGLGWLLALCAYWVFGWEPLPGWEFVLVLATAIALPLMACVSLRVPRLGERVWGIKNGRTRFRDPTDDAKAGILTVALFTGCAIVFGSTIGSHPYWQAAGEEIHLPAIVPPSDWKVLAFYYTMAPWPVAIGGKPVFYSVPYEMGPPQRFVGDISADWIRESVRLTIEGPRTPMDYQARIRKRTELKECFNESPLLHPGCVAIRQLTLERHLEELRDLGYTKFQISWFSADNPGIPEEQRAQGVRLRAIAGTRTQDRYVLITPNGIHQALELSYLDNQEGHLAERDLKVSLGALRISEDLAPGRAWTDNLLGSVRLNRLPPPFGEKYLAALSDIQSSLVSMVSVSPSSFEAYYHLAGLNMLLLRYATARKDDVENLAPLRTLARAMVERMDRYGHDVDPASPQLQALDQLAQQAKLF